MYYFLPLYIFLLQFICQLKQFISYEISGSLGSECEDGRCLIMEAVCASKISVYFSDTIKESPVTLVM
jgi:hypothetical protein